MWNVIFQFGMSQKWIKSLGLGPPCTNSRILMGIWCSSLVCLTIFLKRTFIPFPLKPTIRCMEVIQRFTVKAFKWSSVPQPFILTSFRIRPICQLSLIFLCQKRLSMGSHPFFGLACVRQVFLFLISLGRLNIPSHPLLATQNQTAFPVSCVSVIQGMPIWLPLKGSYFCGIGNLASVCIEFRNSCGSGLMKSLWDNAWWCCLL